VSPLTAVSEEAQRALRDRPSLSIRTRLMVGLGIWLVLSVGITVVSILLMTQAQAKLRILGAVDRYTFEIQQARRFEKNYFLYHTNLIEALEQVHAAQEILRRESQSMAAVIGEESVQAMRDGVRRYEELLASLRAVDPEAEPERLAEIEGELRVHGADMVTRAEDLATQERRAMEGLLTTSRHIAVGFLVGLLVLIVLLARFIATQMLAPLSRIMMAVQRIGEGDLTPITPRRRYHDEFSELATAINLMLHELVQRQQLLVQAHKLQAIGTLTAGVAHELNNPINNLMLTAASLDEDFDEIDEDEKREMASDLVSECERARDIVRNLLDFARETDVEQTSLDVEQILTETLQLASNQIKLAKVKVRGEVQESLPPVYGDRRQLIQVFLNLVLNALDAMLDGGTLTITVEVSEDGGFVEIGFADDGVGIPQAHLSHIFEPFFSTKDHARGTGLGLAVSLGIIKQHGGDMRVESEVGVGTIITVSLPIALVPARIGEEPEIGGREDEPVLQDA
jgi:signal transduction histidine kinase